MEIKNFIEEDFVNYKKPCMFLATSRCSFKCEIENPDCKCQNSELANAPCFKINDEKLIQRYLNNNITESVVIGGLEPFDTFDEVHTFIWKFRQMCNDEIVIYTGYNLSEIWEKVRKLYKFNKIIIKFGRFVPNNAGRYEEILGVRLASDNQMAMTIEDIKRIDGGKCDEV